LGDIRLSIAFLSVLSALQALFLCLDSGRRRKRSGEHRGCRNGGESSEETNFGGFETARLLNGGGAGQNN